MKRQLKKLSLSRETLQNLTHPELGRVVGGVSVDLGVCNTSWGAGACPPTACVCSQQDNC